MDVWRCKVLLRYGIRNNVGLYRCRLCGGDVGRLAQADRHIRLAHRKVELLVGGDQR